MDGWMEERGMDRKEQTKQNKATVLSLGPSKSVVLGAHMDQCILDGTFSHVSPPCTHTLHSMSETSETLVLQKPKYRHDSFSLSLSRV